MRRAASRSLVRSGTFKLDADGDDHIQQTLDPEFSKLLNQRTKLPFRLAATSKRII